MGKAILIAGLLASLNLGCGYMDRPGSRIVVCTSVPAKSAIQFGLDTSPYMTASFIGLHGDCIPYRDFVKVGDKTETDYHFKVLVTAMIRCNVLQKDLWPFSAPTSLLKVNLISGNKVVLASQTTTHEFHIDGVDDSETVTFTGLTDFDVARLDHAELAWVYSR